MGLAIAWLAAHCSSKLPQVLEGSSHTLAPCLTRQWQHSCMHARTAGVAEGLAVSAVWAFDLSNHPCNRYYDANLF